jgi:lipopolysaccharide transport system permease protein
MVPAEWRTLYALNPMVGVVEGFRWALVGRTNLDAATVGVSLAAVLVLLVGGLFFFRRTERTFADVI